MMAIHCIEGAKLESHVYMHSFEYIFLLLRNYLYNGLIHICMFDITYIDFQNTLGYQSNWVMSFRVQMINPIS